MIKSLWSAIILAMFLTSNASAELTVSQQIQQIYIGYLGRAADAAGLAYWTGQVEQGAITVDQIRINIVNEQPEYLENYGQLSFAELAVKVYENLLNRAPDQGGLDYWVGQLTTGAVPPADLILAYIKGVSSQEDADILANKLTVAECYTSNSAIYSEDVVEAIISALDSSASYAQCPPVANAGADQSGVNQGSVQLSGSGADVEGGVLTYLWQQLSGSGVALSSSTISNPVFTANEDGTYTFQLTVTDNAGAMSTDTVAITVGGGTVGGEVAQADFDLLLQSGVWRFTNNFDFTFAQQVDLFGTNYTINAMTDIEGVGVSAIQYNGVNDVTLNDCDANGAQQLNSDDYDEDLLSQEFDDDEDVCEFSYKFFKLSSTHYRVEFYCDANLSGYIEGNKLSSGSDFNFGSLSFTSNQFADLNTSSGVCGAKQTSNVASVVTPSNPNLPDSNITQSSIEVGAPYQDSWVFLQFEFGKPVTPGTYAIALTGGEDQVTAEAYSSIFGGSPGDPASMFAISGSVTVSAIGDNSASGSFNLLMSSGDNLQGNFNFNLQ
jgi:hypothetical protein